MIEFFAVVAPARAGTTWFSELLTTDRSFCYHELTALLQPYPSNLALHDWFKQQVVDHGFELAQRRWLLQCYPTYFTRLWERANYGQYIVGNSDGTMMRVAAGLWLLWPAMKFIFSIRNGINVVASRYAGASAIPPGVLAQAKERWATNDLFQILCHRWSKSVEASITTRRWLADRQAHCFETTLEKVTTDLEELRRLWDWLGIGAWDEYAERNAGLQATPANPRTNTRGVVQPEQIWERWTPEQRDLFRSTCGEAMTQFGYEIPT